MKLSNNLLSGQRRPRTKWLHPIRVLLTAALVFTATILVWILPRQTTSEIEQRELAKFPRFSVEALLSGDYFDDISLWFSDTFPARETFVGMSSDIRRTFGLQEEVIHGTVQQGDTIPDAPVTRPTAPVTSVGSTTSSAASGTADSTTVSSTTTTTSAVDADILQQNQSLSAILVKGDTAYEYYNFVNSTADSYAAILNRAYMKLGDSAKVYSLVAPTSIDVMLAPSARPANSSDQGKAINYLYGRMLQEITVVDARSTLLNHRSEYIYFHTDHHWTARGAYYAFTQFAKAAGKTAPALSAFEEKVFPEFLGSFYAQTQNAGLKLGGDSIYTYKPTGNISMVYGKTSKATSSYPIIADVNGWNPRYKYSTFIGGDNAYTCITNEDITDGSSVVLIKDSYGNAFAPFLASVYHKVHIIDFRYFTEDLTAFVKNNNVQDVLFLNNISATRNSMLVNKLNEFIGN